MSRRCLRRLLAVTLVALVVLVWQLTGGGGLLVWVGVACAAVSVALNLAHPNRRGWG